MILKRFLLLLYIMKNKIINRRDRFKHEKLYKAVDFKRKKGKKIPSELFTIPEIHEYEKIISLKYNNFQLKLILKHYKQGVSGNKKVLIHRLYNFLKLSYYCIIIQKNFRRYLIKKYIKLGGPALVNYNICTNSTDFLSLENLKKTNKENFFSFKDEDGFIYGFEFRSIYNLILRSNHPKNPYNRKKIPKKIIKDIKTKKSLGSLLNRKIQINLDNVGLKDRFCLKVLEVFQKIDALGNYTNVDWFLNLNKFRLIKFTKELLDIWQYRAQLTFDTKRKICPPHGDPFRGLKINIMIDKDLTYLQKKVLMIIETFIDNGIDKSSKALGSFYVLGALTLVSSGAADALPWLYQSMRHNNQTLPVL